MQERIVILIEPCLKAEVQRIAKEHERSTSAQCVWIIKEWVREQHKSAVETAETAPA